MRSLILGHRGMVGSAIHRVLPEAHYYSDADLTKGRDALAHNCAGIETWYVCAARVGGIARNIAEPGQMIYENLMIQCNVIEAARKSGVKLIVFLGSSCIYPAYQAHGGTSAFLESDLMTGPLEPTNEPYAIAKIAGIKMLEAYQRQYGMEFLAVMPCNLYGPGDNYDPEISHFIAGMLRRFHVAKISGAKSIRLWGTGKPRREVMHVDDCARIIVELVQKGARGIVNIGPGNDAEISAYAKWVAQAVGYDGAIDWDHSKPDGVSRKLLDVTKMRLLGIHPHIGITEGLESTYADALAKDWKR